MPYTIETSGLTKSYGSLRVLDGLDLRVETGTVLMMARLRHLPRPRRAGAPTSCWPASTCSARATARTTSVSVAHDMTQGVVDRFRSLPIVSSALLTGHVTASVLRNVVSKLQWIAERQPITPLVDTLRALTTGAPGGDALAAVLWCAGGIVLGCTGAAWLYRRRTRA